MHYGNLLIKSIRSIWNSIRGEEAFRFSNRDQMNEILDKILKQSVLKSCKSLKKVVVNADRNSMILYKYIV